VLRIAGLSSALLCVVIILYATRNYRSRWPEDRSLKIGQALLGGCQPTVEVADYHADRAVPPQFVWRHRRFVGVLDHRESLPHLPACLPSVILGDPRELARKGHPVAAPALGDEGALVVLEQRRAGGADHLPNLRASGLVVFNADRLGEHLEREQVSRIH
jgi:hypothetical protein